MTNYEKAKEMLESYLKKFGKTLNEDDAFMFEMCLQALEDAIYLGLKGEPE